MFQIFICLQLMAQTPLLDESFTNAEFPPVGWDTLRSDSSMGDWYRYNYTTGYPDTYHSRVRVYDASNIYRSGFSTLTAPMIDLQTASGAESLFFWYRFSRYNTNLGPDDTIFIDISNDETNWYSLYKISESEQDTAWQTPRISLAGYDSYSSARVRFHFVDEPNDSLYYQNGNFWLDSVKVINYLVDTIPPVITSTIPVSSDTGIGVSANITCLFSEALDTSSIAGSIIVTGSNSGNHNGTLSYDSINLSIVFNPNVDFSYAETISVLVLDSILDQSGNRLDGDNNGVPGGNFTFWFTTASGPDTIPPSAITDLSCAEILHNAVKLRWTAPGDDGNMGRASFYDIRYSNLFITEANFPAANQALNEPPPSSSGQADSFQVTGLFSNTLYYFAIKTADEDSNWSLISNVPSCTTATQLETLLVVNELFVDPVTYDHNHNNNYNDMDEEFIEIFNKNTYSITLTNYKISDFIGGNSLILTNSFNIPPFGYLLVYASGEGLIISGDGDTLLYSNWTGSWPNLDQVGDTIILLDWLDRELDRKSYTSGDVHPDYTIARLPNGSETWVNTSFPTPGRSNGDAYVWPIAFAFIDSDSNYVPDIMDSIVTITGVITAPPGIFSTSEAYIQDNTGGVCLFGDFPISLDYADSLLVTGTVNQYRGKNELSDFTYSIVQHNAAMPEPLAIGASELNTEAYEGMLVCLGVSYFDGLQLEANTEYTAWDTLNGSFAVWIDSYTDIPGSLAPIDTFTIYGIKGQYSYSTPPNDGYQLMPRSINDFSHLFTLPAMKTIAEVQTPGDDGVSSKYVDSLVCVQGLLTGPSFVFTSGSSPSFYIQDSTAGVNIYGPEGDNNFYSYIDSLGARLTIVGTVTEYNGLTEISRGYGWFIDMDTVYTAKELPQNCFITESMEGSLMRMRGVVKTIPYKSGDGYNFEIANGDVGIAVRFTTASGINPTSIQKDQELIITGIAGQYDYEAPYTSGYQLLPRFITDLVPPGYDSASAEPKIMLNGPKTFIPEIGEQARIEINSPLDHRMELGLYDMNYRLVRELYNGAGGPRTIFWNGNNGSGSKCPLGIYLLNLKAVDPNGKAQYRRMLIVLGTEF